MLSRPFPTHATTPIPPPTGWATPADDWSDDPSFDFDEGGMLPTSSPASTTSRSSRQSRERKLSGSPLRQMHLKGIIEDDFVLDDHAFDDGPPTLKSRIPLPVHSPSATTSTLLRKGDSPTSTLRRKGSSPRTSMKTLTLNATVMGAGPKGVGVITRLGSGPSGKAMPSGGVKTKARAIEKAWDGDLDFDSSFDGLTGTIGSGGGSLKLKLTPKSLSDQLADMNALDDFPDLDDGDQDTLKASATLKAKLPPPRRRDDQATIKPKVKSSPVEAPKPEEDDLEDDLLLPLNLTNLTLATGSQPARKLRPRTSMASTATTATTATDWDAPTTPSTTGRKSIAGAFSWGDESPSRGRHCETSMTSVSDCAGRDSLKDKDEVDEEDYEDGLVLPDPSFFASRNAQTLNQILDRKRKQQYAPPPLPPLPQRGDDSFEDGIVFDNPRAELTHRRLEKNRRNRTIPTPFILGADRKKTEASKLGHPFFPFPPPPVPPSAAPPQRARSPGGSLRSNMGKTRPESPFFRSGSRSRRTSDNAMQPPPMPPLPSRATAPNLAAHSTSHRLRTQKSQHNLTTAPSPTLTRKQSLASMQDAIASGHRPSELPQHPPLPIMPGEKPGSRLTMPTSSSLAKMRPPVNTTFNRNKIRTMEMPRRTKQWGDGTELDGLEDLRVDDDAKSPRSTGSKSPHATLRARKSSDRAIAKQPPTPTAASFKAEEKDKKKRRQRKPALNLIRNLGATDKPKTVGEMTWNPRTSRWEGNEGVLRDFDAVASSTRPALISHFTGSSVASSAHTNAPQARIFGDMKFDPDRMCWISLLPPDEVEPDPFADMADDEGSVCSAGGSGTIRALPHKLVNIGISSRFVSDTSVGTGLTTASAATGYTGLSTLTSASWEDRTPLRTEMPELWAECREAEERHRREMRGWVLRPVQSQNDLRDRERREEKRLWEVRNLALRS
ncbi:hypothetical protein CspeluHIS016_0602920 [Cutaneotrichosporon spelunceum]|uniref:Cytokinesis regulator n=1 Tax=Cutaneotrichosporon spelunceum TaxID=1672016 RepID=A0AAD3YD60_9TREE|nr:hypothetical protein CspeluHIS016_0602920 [Cutaneotrichosporon spelunceum]